MHSGILEISDMQYLELEKLGFGAFRPLKGFMTEADFFSVVETLTLENGEVFPLPVVLDITEEQRKQLIAFERIDLKCRDELVGELFPESFFTCDKRAVAKKVYGTDRAKHPGVAHFYSMGDHFVGGKVRLNKRLRFEFSEFELTPKETKAFFKQAGWRTVVGFQTRNVPHRAHEYLLRLALEQADGVFVQPLVGRKKVGDYTPEAILKAYEVLKEKFLPPNKVLLGVLSTAMRYAGPREAVFHAIIRRNYGCTHFIVGRDHAGVGDYYGKYDAHRLTEKFEDRLGIKVLRFAGPFYCSVCDAIVTERTCPHLHTAPDAVDLISGTMVRDAIEKQLSPSPEIMRPEILESIREMPVLIESAEQ